MQRDRWHALRRAHDAVLSGGSPTAAPRPVISESWRRSLAAQVNPDQHEAPMVFEADELGHVRDTHPLAVALPVLRDTLVGIADDAQHIMIITDADGHILWCEGSNHVRRLADGIRLAEGASWAEESTGTNGIGTALAVDRLVTVHSAEHLVRTYHDWTCTASPIRDPDTGRTVGVVDLSGPLSIAHPAVGALVAAAARLAEGQLHVQATARDELVRSRNMRHLIALRGESGALVSSTGRVLAAEPHGLLPARVDVTAGLVRLADGRHGVLEPLAEGYLLRVPRSTGRPRRPVLSLSFLGLDPTAVLDGREVPLTLRHAELLTALVLHPNGLTAEQLALKLYGERGNPTTVRAELHRLRAQLGVGVLQTRPYRLCAEVQGDFLAVRAALRSGDVRSVASGYQAALLPKSEAPVVRDERDDLLAAVRRAVLTGDDVENLWAFAQTDSGHDDVEALERLVRLMPKTDTRRGLVSAKLRRALEDG
jgi:hypothetical protein